MCKFFIFCAFAWVVMIIFVAANLPLEHWLNQQWLWGVQGLVPTAMICPMAFPAFGFLILAMIYE